MKKLKIAIKIVTAFLGVLFLHTTCSDDILNQANPNAISPETFWKTDEDAIKGIIGAYSPFSSIEYYSRMEVLVTDYRDDVINSFGTGLPTPYFGTPPGDFVSNVVWQSMYKGVSRANEVLFFVPNIDMDTQERDNITGEGYFIRAFNYFNLVNTWLNIPLITKPFSEIENPLDITQAPPSEVWAHIESDLKQAQNLLPKSWLDEYQGRATSGAATGMLGKVYLYQGKYAEAKAELSKIMDGSYDLMDDYAHNFTEESENNKESLFEIQLIADGNTGWGGDAPGLGKGASYQPDLAPSGLNAGQTGMRVNQWTLDLFLDERTINDELDPRVYTTLFFNSNETTDYEGKTLSSRTYGNKTYEEVYSATATEIYGNKHLDWEFNGLSSAGFHNSGNNLRILRYADVLLMFAEAEFMLNGSTDAALDAINQVRARVDMPAFTTITIQDIKDERVKELTFERTRYYDLLRWDEVKSRIVDNPDLKSESAGTDSYKPGREYLPIPQNEIDQNPNIKQNTGY